MADRFLNASFVDNDESWSDKLRAAGSGASGPYVDGRLLGNYLQPGMKVATATFTPHATPASATTVYTSEAGIGDSTFATTLVAADDIQFSVGFRPLLAILTMEDVASSTLTVKALGMAGQYAFVIADANSTAYTNSLIEFSAHASDPDGGVVTVLTGATTNEKVHNIVIIGQ